MNFFQAIVLGVVQGITEFLPISSSAHLVITRQFFGLPEIDGFLLFDAVLHLATAFVILFYFRKDIVDIVRPFFEDSFQEEREKSKRLLTMLGIATVPAVIIGLTLEEMIVRNLRELPTIIITLIFGAFLLMFVERLAVKRAKVEQDQRKGGNQNPRGITNLTWKKSLIIGFFQSLALIPGMSRSGSTLSGGIIMGMNKVDATRFAFFLGLPILFGVGGLKLIDALAHGGINLGLVAAGSISAMISGFFAMKVLMYIVREKSLNYFAWYRIGLAVLLLLFFI